MKKKLNQSFELKDLGPLHHFLGVKIVQCREGGLIWIGQPLYTEKILRKYGMFDCKPVSTPVNQAVKLVASKDDDDQPMYQAIVGCLLNRATKTKPDIAYSVARFSAKPNKVHWIAVKRILRYLKGTIQLGHNYKQDAPCVFPGYSDADWAGYTSDRKSTSGYVFIMAGAAISWKRNKQTCVALSTTEAEYIALSAATHERFIDPETKVFEDN